MQLSPTKNWCRQFVYNMMFSALKLFLFICWLLGNFFIFIWEVSIVDIFCCVFVYNFFLFFVLCVFFCFCFAFLFFVWVLGVGGCEGSFFLRIICFCLKSWFLVSVSLNTKCALWVILMQLKMTFVRPITSVTPDLVLRSHPGDMYRCPDGGNPTTKSWQ